MNATYVKITNTSNIPIKISLTHTYNANIPSSNYTTINSGKSIDHTISADNMNLFILNNDMKLLWHGVIPTINEITYTSGKCVVDGKDIPEGFLPITSLITKEKTSNTSNPTNYEWWILLLTLIVIGLGVWYMTS